MKKFHFLVISLFASVSLCSAQTINDYIQSIEMIDMGNDERSNCSELCYFDGAVYFTYFDEDDEVKDRHFLVKKTPTSSDTIAFSVFHLMYKKGFLNIIVDSNFVILQDQFFSYYYKRELNNLKYLLFKPHKEKSKNSKIFGQSYYIPYCNIQGGSLFEKTQTWVEVVDLEKKTHRIIEFPNPSGIECMYFQPRKLIEITKDNVYIMDVTDYKIRIYDYNGKLLDSIYKPFKNNPIIIPEVKVAKADEEYPFDLMHQKYAYSISEYREILNNAKVMCSINLLSDTTMMICYNEPTEGNKWYTYAFDLWKFDTKKKKWAVVKEGLKMESYEYEEREGNFDIKRIPLHNKFVAYYNNILVTQNKYNYDILNLKTYTTWKEFHGLNEDYLKKSEIPNTIFIYKLWF